MQAKKLAEKKNTLTASRTVDSETSPLRVSLPLAAYTDGPVPSLSSLKARITNTGALPEGMEYP